MRSAAMASFRILVVFALMLFAAPAIAQQPHSQLIEANGQKIHYLVAGKGPVVVAAWLYADQPYVVAVDCRTEQNQHGYRT